MNANGPVERKVSVASITATLTSLVMLALLKQFPMLATLADPLEYLIYAGITGVVTFLMAWWAKHTPRNDTATRKGGVSDPIPPTG